MSQSKLINELNKLNKEHGVSLVWFVYNHENELSRQIAACTIPGTAIKIRVTTMPERCEIKTTKIEICIDNRTEATLDSERWKNKFDNVGISVEATYIWMKEMLVAMVDSIDKVVRLQPSGICGCGNVALAGSALCSYCYDNTTNIGTLADEI